MKTFAIGDVHGCFDALIAVRNLAKISENDQVIWLGDYVDRGPDSAKVIRYLLELDPERNQFLKGNHEIMMQDGISSFETLQRWRFAEGAETWESYVTEFGEQGIETIPKSHRKFLSELKPYFETDTHLFVHASFDSELEPSQQFEDALFWAKFDSMGPHKSGKHVVCGHSSQKDGIPKSRPHATCIDTWAYGGAWLTCLDVHSRRYFQANQNGETNTHWLD